MLSGHEKDITPCGDSSPYARICRRGGKLAFLGTGLGCNTTLHAVEEAASLEYLFDEFHDLYTIDYDGSRLHVPQRRHSEGFGRRFAEMGELFERWGGGIIRRASAGAATIEVVDAGAMWELMRPMVAEDPFCLLRKDAAELFRKWYDSRPRSRRRGQRRENR